jgi:hypothetical protein
MDEYKTITPIAALVLISQATRRAVDEMDDERRDRQLILERLIASTHEIIGRVR